MEITGNEDDGIVSSSAKAREWLPKGRIMYYDYTLNKNVGMHGVLVKARRWFTTHTAIVNEYGHFVCPNGFKRPADYSFELEKDDFNLKGDSFIPTSYGANNISGDWNFTFNKRVNSLEYFAATVFRAAYHYYYKDIKGLHRPPTSGFLRSKLNIKLINEVNNSNTNMSRKLLDGNQIKIYSNYKIDETIYATTIHELAHAAHWQLIVDADGSNRNRDYHNNELNVLEGWARGVQWYLTKDVYPNYLGGETRGYYTQIVVDLIDTEADDRKNRGYNSIEGDNVTIPMTDVESSLIGINNLNEWKNNIKSKYNYETGKAIDELFDLWF